MSDCTIIQFPGRTRCDDTEDRSPQVVPAAPVEVSPAQRHLLEVKLDIARERVLLWRIAVVFAGLTALMLVRQVLVG